MTNNYYTAALIKISQELNCSNRLTLDSVLQRVKNIRGRKKIDADTLLESEILYQRMLLIDSLLNHLSRINDEDTGEQAAASEEAPTDDQSANTDDHLKGELEELIMVCLRLFDKMEVSSGSILSEIALRMSQRENNEPNNKTDEDK